MRLLLIVSLVQASVALNLKKNEFGWGIKDAKDLGVKATVAVGSAVALNEMAKRSAEAAEEQDPSLLDQATASAMATASEMAERQKKQIEDGVSTLSSKDPRKLDMIRGMLDQSVINPVEGIVKKHDKEQIASLKRQGKIAEGFPDLTFTHIPKTGGDAFAIASTPLFPYGFGLRANLALHLMIDPTKQSSDYCYFEQMPPQKVMDVYSKKVADQAYGKRTVFCSVRNPYDRMVSEWHNCVEFGVPGECATDCDAADMNKWIRTQLTAFKDGDYYRHGCFYVPQTDYMEGEGACTELLDFNHLERDFNTLMKKHGYNLTLPAQDDTHRTFSKKCQGKVTAAHLEKETRSLIEEVYAKDFEKLGVQMGWVKEGFVSKLKRYITEPINALTSEISKEATLGLKVVTGDSEIME